MIGAITANSAFLNDNATALQWYQQKWRRSGKAALRLGQIFDKCIPSAGIFRDYGESVPCYKKARELGMTLGTTPDGTPLIGGFGRPGPKSR
jgi:hypothetical protein